MSIGAINILFVVLLIYAGAGFANPLEFAPAQFPAPIMQKVKLGQALFYDSILSGNKTVSCATCHHPRHGTSDGLSLGIGDGGIGMGPDRKPAPNNLPEQRVPRNSPSLFNLGARQFASLFHDGRLEKDPGRPSGLRTPLEDEMVEGFDSVLSAQAMFPVLSPDEMAGHYAENDVARAVRKGLITGDGGAWDIIARRIRAIDGYAEQFLALGVARDQITFTDIANAIGAFVAYEWQADDSPFDRFVFAGEPLPPLARKGLDLFYGRANCGECHSGLFQTDHKFHAIAVPQLGPGKATRFESHARDMGRFHVTGDAQDAFRFRTPSLRNIVFTAPYGHSGAFRELRDIIHHHADPVVSFSTYDRDVVLPDLPGVNDWRIMNDEQERKALLDANELGPVVLSKNDIDALLAFLESLTDRREKRGRLGVPKSVPSGLPVPQ